MIIDVYKSCYPLIRVPLVFRLWGDQKLNSTQEAPLICPLLGGGWVAPKGKLRPHFQSDFVPSNPASHNAKQKKRLTSVYIRTLQCCPSAYTIMAGPLLGKRCCVGSSTVREWDDSALCLLPPPLQSAPTPTPPLPSPPPPPLPLRVVNGESSPSMSPCW